MEISIFMKMKGEIFIINEEITLFIPENLTNDKTFSNYAIAVYCVLNALSVPTKLKSQCITQQQIEFYLTGNISKRRIINDYIKCGINELVDNNVVTKIDEVSKHYVLDCSNMWIDTDKVNFTTITFNEVQRIFNIENINNFLMLRYFIILIGSISSKVTVYLPNGEYKNRVVGTFTIDYLSKLSGISERTIIEYNKVLESIGLIYIARQEDFVIDKENNIKRLNNIYGRACDFEYIDTFAQNQKKYNESYKYTNNNLTKSNNKRRLAQMYQQLLKGHGKKYTNEQIKEIYDYVINENKKYEALYEKDKYEDYLDKIRDVEIFEKYEFLKENK